ncbi:SURF1 family protein [Jiella sp. M17.18]|uniref:SURF1 family protein n=1 Tax=Jiella sp. M17.18 TaxID=3234247 RepID=UPI0034DF5245
MRSEAAADERRPLALRGRAMSRTGFAVALAACLLGIAILCGLGTWQVERLQWKQALLARIDAQIHAAPVPVDALAADDAKGRDIEYRRVTASGHFLNEDERYVFTTFDGQSGWNVFTPLVLSGNRMVFVNRGFVPYDLRDPAKRWAGQVAGEVTVTGLARRPPQEKPGYFVPDNDPAKDTFYWRNLDAMRMGLKLPEGMAVLPFFIDAGPGRAPGGWPVGGTTVIAIPNDHLQYALTWYGLAAVLIVMTAMLVRRRFGGRREG